jgi:GNAT superfamily N-acetyltransferase
VNLRPLVSEDADAVLDVMQAAFADLERRLGRDPEPPSSDRAPSLLRILHCAEQDPGGAWVAEVDGEIVGAALAIVREGIWGLSLLVVLPDQQSGGLGRALLAAALAHGNGARGGIILASEDPRALRAYARAGFSLSPCVEAYGPLLRPPEAPVSVRPLRWPADQALVDATGRYVRGASHARDVPAWLGSNQTVLVHEGGGFAVRRGAEVRLVAAHDDDVAAELLRGVLASTPDGAKVGIYFITGGQDWAIEVALDAGLKLRPGGAVMFRGEAAPLRPYIPSGAYL